MNATEESQIKSALDRLIQQTPELGPTPNDMFIRRQGRSFGWAPLTAVAAATVAVVGLGVIVVNRNANTNPASQPTEAEPVPVDTRSSAVSVGTTPTVTPATIPTEFPHDVPRPDTFELMTIMTDNGAPVGWEFSDQGEATDSVERCTDYASAFDASWTSTAITDEAPIVLFARSFTNARWDVGIYCINDGGYLVQVMATGATAPATADTVP